MLGGLVRPGVSFGPEDFRKPRRLPGAPPAVPRKSRPLLTLLAIALWAGLIALWWPYIWPVLGVAFMLLRR
jgi:hypothetical protein